jgi:hypothetical protein
VVISKIHAIDGVEETDTHIVARASHLCLQDTLHERRSTRMEAPPASAER